MKAIKNRAYALGLFILVGLSACQKEEALQPGQEEEQAKEYIQFSSELEDLPFESILSTDTGEELPNDEARMFFDNGRHGSAEGASFLYQAGEELKVQLFFRQGLVTAKSEATFVVEKHEDGRYKLKKQAVAVPAGINLASGNVTITGAIGVENAQIVAGRFTVDVPKSGKLIHSPNGYTVPMIFAPTKVVKDSSKTPAQYSFYAKFKFYGALVGLQVTNPHTTGYLLKELDLTTSAFDTEGTIDITEEQTSWKTTQTATTVKTVELTAKDFNFVVPKNGGSKHIFFWVKPKSFKTASLKVGLKSFETTNRPTNAAYNDGGQPEQIFTVPVKKALVDNKVHRIPAAIKAPIAGGLIFTEIFRGGATGDAGTETAIELYNSSEEPINLANYELWSWDPKTKTYNTSTLIQTSSDHMVVMYDPVREGKVDYWLKPLKDLDALKYYVLPPKRSVVYVSKNVQFDYNNVKSDNPTIRWAFNVGVDQNKGFALRAEGGYLRLVKRPTKAGELPKVEDVFLEFPKNPNHNIWSYTMMRKPDRNVPRLSMEQGKNSDWIARDRTESVDWGRRFGFVYNSNGENEYILGKNNNHNGYLTYLLIGRPLSYLSTDPKHAGFLRGWEANREDYTVPSWWTKGVAH